MRKSGDESGRLEWPLDRVERATISAVNDLPDRLRVFVFGYRFPTVVTADIEVHMAPYIMVFY